MSIDSQGLETKIFVELVRRENVDMGYCIYESFTDRYHHRHFKDLIDACDLGKVEPYLDRRAEVFNRYAMMNYGIPDQR